MLYLKEGIAVQCCVCKAVKLSNEDFVPITQLRELDLKYFDSLYSMFQITHTYCPECIIKVNDTIYNSNRIQKQYFEKAETRRLYLKDIQNLQ